MVLDLEAIVERLGLDGFDLLALHHAGFIGMAYAARHPQRLSHLVLWCAYARASDWWSPDSEAFFSLLDNWERFAYAKAHDRLGWTEPEAAQRSASLIAASIGPESWRASMTSLRSYDATPFLADIQTPVLVLQRRACPFPSLAHAEDLASALPDARLVVLEGSSRAPYLEDSAVVVREINSFLGTAPPEAGSHGTAVILFADIVGSTAMTERIGDAAFRERARQLDERMRAAIRGASGTPVEGKLLGDGVLAVFTSARQAIDAALRCAAAGGEFGLQLHLGIHAGDVIREGDNVFGGAVNIASRISGLSEPDELLVSATVRDLARTSAGVTFEDRGEHTLKGIDEPQRVFAVRAKVGG